MSLARFAKKRDTSEGPIIDALEIAGYHVWQLDRPCDLLIWREDMGPGRFRALECKTPSGKHGLARKRNDQPDQTAFVDTTGTPVVTTPMEALRAIGAVA
jgi:hypothetical protein